MAIDQYTIYHGRGVPYGQGVCYIGEAAAALSDPGGSLGGFQVPDYQDLLYAKDDGVAVITLNRPDRLNAFSPGMIDGWRLALEDARDDPGVWAVVVTGAGRAFCAGADTKALAEGDMLSAEHSDSVIATRNRLRDSVHRIPRVLATLDKPYIAAVNGAAAGAGMDMASMADLRFASDQARFRMSYSLMGIVPGDAGCYFLPRIIGVARALELIWTARIIDAEEALRMGYLTRVVPADALMSETLEFARALANGPRVATEMAKRMAYNMLNMDLNAALDYSQMGMTIARATEDSKEGPKAFVEKRAPRFQGR